MHQKQVSIPCVFIFAVNNNDPSVVSGSGSGEVLDSAFDHIPSSPLFTGLITTTNNVTILWSHGPSVISYNVSWSYIGPCSSKASSDLHQTLDGSTRSFTVTDLRPNSQYLVRVEAGNNVGSVASQITVSTGIEGTYMYALL